MKLNATTGAAGTPLTLADHSIVVGDGSFAVAPARARLGTPTGLRRRMAAVIVGADRGNTICPSAAFDVPAMKQSPVPLLLRERCT